jgi:hypothetical protein
MEDENIFFHRHSIALSISTFMVHKTVMIFDDEFMMIYLASDKME